jgi:rhodanese-related sulfurtransferase
MKNQQLNISAIFFAVIMAAVAFCVITCSGYEISNASAAKKTADSEHFDYAELNTLLTSGEGQGYFLVDLRDANDYLQGHIPGAVHIPFSELLDRKHHKRLSNKSPVLLYSDAEHITAAAQLILVGQGIENVRIIPGDFSSIRQYVLDGFNPTRAFYSEDKARFDYRRFMDVRATGPSHESPATPAIPEVEDSPPLVGGC